MPDFYGNRLGTLSVKLAREMDTTDADIYNTMRLIARQIAIEFAEGTWRKNPDKLASGKVLFPSYTLSILTAVMVEFLGLQDGFNFTDYSSEEFVKLMTKLLTPDELMLRVIYQNYQKYVWGSEGDNEQ